ncbi:PS-10 peptidase S37 [Amycolatopsis arida]|uniref:PS-10 peptidase S37 n=1 Tax=Amycolatopsis arida TaxID=587909 RepID=A0A1I6ALP7_9PSEU|nr:S28 family serine protease [Amycolatopsis arida]TDX87379.1 PS-10 peptidase S37 [Amycolatopsis arida]SFQ69562.1 PS-10 peptidase S37 [Amycolatopsis arida]
MPFPRRRTVASGVVVTLIAGLTAVWAPAPASGEAGADIRARLERIEGLTVVSESPTPPPGYRFFVLSFRQPTDHRDPAAGTFEQRFQLLHRSVDRPMVLHTTGYGMPERAFRSEPARLVDGNQISTEQRFFTPSRPEPANWEHLTIWQAATDHHRIVRALKRVYREPWISTGASKGGMTSVYHRRFYPHDVAGVAAYVAPNDRINPADHAYDRFFDRVGGDPACRRALADVQREALRRRPELVERYQAWAAAENRTFHQVLGTVDKAFEMTVLDLVWAFWQYGTEADCATVPAITATTDAIYEFVDRVVDWSFYTDQGVLPYAPYYYQAATQLGAPSLRFRHLRHLMHYPPSFYGPNSNLPPRLRRHHDPWPMIDVDTWVRTRSSRMLFVYGANDPWGAEPFVPSRHDSYRFTAPGANHGADISALPPGERDRATAALLRWADVDSQPATARSAPTELDEAERELRRERRPR